MGRLMTDARSLHCKEEGVVGKSDVGEGKFTSAWVDKSTKKVFFTI